VEFLSANGKGDLAAGIDPAGQAHVELAAQGPARPCADVGIGVKAWVPRPGWAAAMA
jgi:hypothetical protein